MKIAIEGCAHGELETIYNTLELLEKNEGIKIDLLICCGDFQSTRNLEDLCCMAVPKCYQKICTFYKYYSGEKVAPYLTIFIGGNHEASNYLQELPYGGWVAPKIYYLGYAGVVNIAGVRIGGISGIFKPFNYQKGHFEKAPYNENDKRSVYHIRNLEVFRLKQLSKNVDICLSHDWPNGITDHGNVKQLLSRKQFFKEDIESRKLGSQPCTEILNKLKPKYWFSAHLHCKFAAIVKHDEPQGENKETKFLALDKCLPRRRFLQILDIEHDPDQKVEIKYDLEWLAILYLTNHLLSIKNRTQYMPGPGSPNRWKFTPTKEEKDFVLEKFGHNLEVPLNFVPTAPTYDPNDCKKNAEQPIGQTNPQTQLFCEKLSIDDPTNLVLNISNNSTSQLDVSSTFTPPASATPFVSRSVELKQSKINLSLPESPVPPLKKLNLTLPPPKNLDLSTDSIETKSLQHEVLNSSFDSTDNSFLETEGLTSTPQTKKFKRRNESIYKPEND